MVLRLVPISVSTIAELGGGGTYSNATTAMPFVGLSVATVQTVASIGMVMVMATDGRRLVVAVGKSPAAGSEKWAEPELMGVWPFCWTDQLMFHAESSKSKHKVVVVRNRTSASVSASVSASETGSQLEADDEPRCQGSGYA